MKILTFQARRFRWKPFAKTLEDADDAEVEEAVGDAVVAFLHVEASDEGKRTSVVRQTLKHLKWLANKRGMKNVVLHSFTHLGGASADPVFAGALLAELSERLVGTGYTVARTPYGYFCEWGLEVYGESLAKVYKEI